jgi:hypothetical protein
MLASKAPTRLHRGDHFYFSQQISFPFGGPGYRPMLGLGAYPGGDHFSIFAGREERRRGSLNERLFRPPQVHVPAIPDNSPQISAGLSCQATRPGDGHLIFRDSFCPCSRPLQPASRPPRGDHFFSAGSFCSLLGGRPPGAPSGQATVLHGATLFAPQSPCRAASDGL